jgi:hypothetical protein
MLHDIFCLESMKSEEMQFPIAHFNYTPQPKSIYNPHNNIFPGAVAKMCSCIRNGLYSRRKITASFTDR